MDKSRIYYVLSNNQPSVLSGNNNDNITISLGTLKKILNAISKALEKNKNSYYTSYKEEILSYLNDISENEPANLNSYSNPNQFRFSLSSSSLLFDSEEIQYLSKLYCLLNAANFKNIKLSDRTSSALKSVSLNIKRLIIRCSNNQKPVEPVELNTSDIRTVDDCYSL